MTPEKENEEARAILHKGGWNSSRDRLDDAVMGLAIGMVQLMEKVDALTAMLENARTYENKPPLVEGQESCLDRVNRAVEGGSYIPNSFEISFLDTLNVNRERYGTMKMSKKQAAVLERILGNLPPDPDTQDAAPADDYEDDCIPF